MVYTLINIEVPSKCSNLCSETTRLRLGSHLSFKHYNVISRVEYGPWKIVNYFLNVCPIMVLHSWCCQ